VRNGEISEERAVNTEEITVGQLKRILRTATDEHTIPEAIEALAEADRRETEDLEHGARVTAYNEYIARRREREHEAVQGAYDEAKQEAIRSRPEIDRERLHVVAMEAADPERLRFEIREPTLSFEEWLDAGQPEIHEIRSAPTLKAKLPRT
jgi:hypothetical protein